MSCHTEDVKKWYLIPPYLTLSDIRLVSRVKWSNLGKGVAPSLTPRCSSYWKGSLRVTLDYSHQLYSLTYNYEASWVTLVKGNPNAPFSIATIPICGRGCFYFPWVALLTLDPYLIILGVNQGGIKYLFYFWVFGMTQSEIKPWSPKPLANFLTIMPIIAFAQSAGAIEYTNCTSAEG